MTCHEGTSETPKSLFREGALQITGAEARLDMPCWDLVKVSGQRPEENGSRISLHENDIRSPPLENLADSTEALFSYFGERLPLSHDPEIPIGFQSERSQSLVNQLVVLSSQRQSSLYAAPPLPQGI